MSVLDSAYGNSGEIPVMSSEVFHASPLTVVENSAAFATVADFSTADENFANSSLATYRPSHYEITDFISKRQLSHDSNNIILPCES
jgi:hypothetical protein